VTARKVRKEKDGRDATAVLEWVTANITQRIQLGGDETTGQGFVALRWII
jgi:CRISPR/Cas system CMR subunit Cmr4 (Cas7 group RAMP superfamily)